jgi:hypothetical protein
MTLALNEWLDVSSSVAHKDSMKSVHSITRLFVFRFARSKNDQRFSLEGGEFKLNAKEIFAIHAVSGDNYLCVALPSGPTEKTVLNIPPSISFFKNLLDKKMPNFKIYTGNFIGCGQYEFYNGPSSIQDGLVDVLRK